MQPEPKKIGVLLMEAGLLTAAQLQEALRHQRLAGGRLGSTLVTMGIITEDSLMDFLAKQTGVPRLDVKHLDIPAAVLQRIPRRLAEQLTILPVSFKEPKSLVLAMADPMDLNAMDSARFASGMTIEPMVAGHSALKQAISEHYLRLESGGAQPLAIELGASVSLSESLPVPFEFALTPFDQQGGPNAGISKEYPKDPFFSKTTPVDANPFTFFTPPKASVPPKGQAGIIPERSAMAEHARPLESYGTRALVFGIIRVLQRRGVLGEEELQRLIANLVEAREIDPDQ